jgi:hypothetical protein
MEEAVPTLRTIDPSVTLAPNNSENLQRRVNFLLGPVIMIWAKFTRTTSSDNIINKILHF